MILAVLTGVSYWNYRTTRGQSRLLVQVSAGLLVVMVVLSMIFPPKPAPEEVDVIGLQWDKALGEVMGQRASQLLPQGGEAVVFTWSKNVTEQSSREKHQREAQLEGL